MQLLDHASVATETWDYMRLLRSIFLEIHYLGIMHHVATISRDKFVYKWTRRALFKIAKTILYVNFFSQDAFIIKLLKQCVPPYYWMNNQVLKMLCSTENLIKI